MSSRCVKEHAPEYNEHLACYFDIYYFFIYAIIVQLPMILSIILRKEEIIHKNHISFFYQKLYSVNKFFLSKIDYIYKQILTYKALPCGMNC